jgi:hypothetical protein
LLIQAGQPVPALATTAMQVLRKAARGERVEAALLEDVVTAAEALTSQLAWAVLRRFPGGT